MFVQTQCLASGLQGTIAAARHERRAFGKAGMAAQSCMMGLPDCIGRMVTSNAKLRSGSKELLTRSSNLFCDCKGQG